MSKSVEQVARDKEQKIMETVAWRAGYYRANPQRFVSEVLLTDTNSFKLKWFQQIILWAMMHYNFLAYIAQRGQG